MWCDYFFLIYKNNYFLKNSVQCDYAFIFQIKWGVNARSQEKNR